MFRTRLEVLDREQASMNTTSRSSSRSTPCPPPPTKEEKLLADMKAALEQIIRAAQDGEQTPSRRLEAIKVQAALAYCQLV